ncbi:MAG: hypothetical protein CL943_03510 [Candidatus Diapherotrites archaeon]|uniref:Uncharacterized protein n=1 Tax=Candidatus Iainarchaeum sp. TaxID=3101447 RepID=A0A2D6M1N6_9ARCH|nr:hypothetical protein [Candidatus Diapherotrites archaeon]|tara:strand:- start:678 stop:1310 length:633 start_codon:yes stop_codon:yes gene_type:complete
MIGFTLSKLNLLILVTATFAIVAYFMFGITDVVVSNSAQQTVSTYAEKAASIVGSDSLCFKTEVTVPAHLSYFGGIQTSKRFFYFMNIARFPEDYDPDYLTSVIFSISDRKNPDKLIAASRIDVNAEVLFYDWEPSEVNTIKGDAKAIILDPQSAIMRKDSLIIIKEVLEGKNFLHIITCSSAGTCEANQQKVACNILGRESSCLPCPED